MPSPLLLVVEDEPISREILVSTLQENGYTCLTATTGAEAWQAILAHRDHIDVILLDRMLPDMDSLSLLVKLKADPALTHVPVIMQTSLSSETDIADGLRAGAYYYLTKPFPPDTLLAIVRSALQDHRDYQELQQNLQQAHRIMAHLEHAEFWFRTPVEARDLASLAAHAAPDPGRVVLGLTELMLNAVEHGNLNIGYAEKSALIASNSLDNEVTRRLGLPEFSHRRARLEISNQERQVFFTVSDAGTGFEWRQFIEMSPARAFDTHGRGIAMSKLISFDLLEYRDAGNVVVAGVSR